MNMLAGWILGYIGVTFISSAFMVRFAPKQYSARQIRKHLILFLVAPVLYFVDLVCLLDTLAISLGRSSRRAFEFLSGRGFYRPVSLYYRNGGKPVGGLHLRAARKFRSAARRRKRRDTAP